MDIIYSTDATCTTESTDAKTTAETIIKRTCNSCKQNPLMKDCTCNAEMTDISHPACIIVHQAMEKVFPSA